MTWIGFLWFRMVTSARAVVKTVANGLIP